MPDLNEIETRLAQLETSLGDKIKYFIKQAMPADTEARIAAVEDANAKLIAVLLAHGIRLP